MYNIPFMIIIKQKNNRKWREIELCHRLARITLSISIDLRTKYSIAYYTKSI